MEIANVSVNISSPLAVAIVGNTKKTWPWRYLVYVRITSSWLGATCGDG